MSGRDLYKRVKFLFGSETRIVPDGPQVRQFISDERTTDLPLLDFSQQAEPQRLAQEWMSGLFTTAVFSTLQQIENRELFQPCLIKVSEDEYWYALCCHHLILDGWGGANWIRALGAYYHGSAVTQPLRWACRCITTEASGRSKRLVCSPAFDVAVNSN